MPQATYIPLATHTLTGNDTEVIFSSIPNTYRDLILIVDGTASPTTNIFIRFNGDNTNSNYSRVFMLGTGSTTQSGSTALNDWGVLVSSGRSTNILQFMDYSATDKHKTALIRSNNGGTLDVIAYAGRWANTAAINQISVVATTMLTGTTLNLYGIAG